MDSFLLKIFHSQVWIQCKFALKAYAELSACLTEMRTMKDPPVDTSKLSHLPRDELVLESIEMGSELPIRAWFSIQAFLTATANLSKAFWGQGGRLHVEREPLRNSLGIDDSSSLRGTSMRNNFDHFDERLQEWWDARYPALPPYVDLNFDDGTLTNVPDEDVFRSYNPVTGDVVFWGKRYNLPSIVAEIESITPIATKNAFLA